MQKFVQHSGVVVPLDRTNVDTDMIIPKQFLKSIKRSGFGPNLFDEYRYLDEGEVGQDCSLRPLNTEFVVKNRRDGGLSIVLTRDNFGCGSSREHAPWALDDFGIKAIIAPSYAEIFYNNCMKNGLLPIILEEDQVDKLFEEAAGEEGYQLTIDLENQQITKPGGEQLEFEIDSFRRHLQRRIEWLQKVIHFYSEAIKSYEVRRRQEAPWLFEKRR